MDELVSVVCLCFNHRKFVMEAIRSVIQQTYNNIEIIIVDDGSTDGSPEIICEIVDTNPKVKFLPLDINIGNCAAFNRGLNLANGDFVIDFATDDLMVPDRVEKQVNHFKKLDKSYGVIFSNADYIDESGKFTRNHIRHLLDKKLISSVPEGFIFRDVLRRYFICSPTMMIRKQVLAQLRGYDENLSYEDFDFWIRSSKICKYSYQNEVLTKVRRTANSMSSGWYEQGDKQLHSTFLVCEKALLLCRDREDREALMSRVRYEFRQASFSGNKTEAELFGQLEKQLGNHQWSFYFIKLISRLPLPWPWIRKQYHRLFYS